MKTLLLVLGMAWGWAHPAALILAALAEYGLAAALVAILVTRLRRNNGRHGRTRPVPGAAR